MLTGCCFFVFFPLIGQFFVPVINVHSHWHRWTDRCSRQAVVCSQTWPLLWCVCDVSIGVYVTAALCALCLMSTMLHKTVWVCLCVCPCWGQSWCNDLRKNGGHPNRKTSNSIQARSWMGITTDNILYILGMSKMYFKAQVYMMKLITLLMPYKSFTDDASWIS